MSLGSSSHRGRVPSFAGHYEIVLSILLSYFVLFNVMDLFSTSLALSRGLSESNGALIGISQLLGVNIIFAMGLTKIVFIAGASLMSILGVRSQNEKIKKMAFWSILAFVFLFSLVSYSNFLMLLKS